MTEGRCRESPCLTSVVPRRVLGRVVAKDEIWRSIKIEVSRKQGNSCSILLRKIWRFCWANKIFWSYRHFKRKEFLVVQCFNKKIDAISSWACCKVRTTLVRPLRMLPIGMFFLFDYWQVCYVIKNTIMYNRFFTQSRIGLKPCFITAWNIRCSVHINSKHQASKRKNILLWCHKTQRFNIWEHLRNFQILSFSQSNLVLCVTVY